MNNPTTINARWEVEFFTEPALSFFTEMDDVPETITKTSVGKVLRHKGFKVTKENVPDISRVSIEITYWFEKGKG